MPEQLETVVPLPLRLRMELPALREAERKVVQALLANSTETPHLGVTEIARLAKVSEASVMRLCRSFGFRGFRDFKVQLIGDLAIAGAQARPVHGLGDVDEVRQDDDVAAITRKVFRMDMQVLADTLQVLDMQKIGESVDALANASRVELFGAGGSSLIAQDAAYRLLRVGVAATAIADPHMQAIRLALLTPRDVVVGISHTGETRDTVEGFSLAVGAGARTVAITSAPRSTVARMADIALVTSFREGPWRGEAIPPRIVQLALIDAICVAIDVRKEVDAAPTVEKIEQALNQTRTRTGQRAIR